MIDFFAIFSHGGLVLWYFQATSQGIDAPLNNLVKYALLQERAGMEIFNHESLALQYKLDNEFELVYVVGYQRVVKLCYADRLLSDVQREFRDRYKNELLSWRTASSSTALATGTFPAFNICDFKKVFDGILEPLEQEDRQAKVQPRPMRSFEQSAKSSKTVKSIIKSEGMWGAVPDEAEPSGGKKKRKGKRGGGKGPAIEAAPDALGANHSSSEAENGDGGLGSSGSSREDVLNKSLPAGSSVALSGSGPHSGDTPPSAPEEEDHSASTPPELLKHIAPIAPLSQEDILKRLQAKHGAPSKEKKKGEAAGSSAGGKQTAKGKQARTWDLNGGGGKSGTELDFSSKSSSQKAKGADSHSLVNGGGGAMADGAESDRSLIGSMEGELRDLDVPEDAPDADAGAGDEPDENEQVAAAAGADQKSQPKSRFGGFGVMNIFKSLVGNKVLTTESLKPAIDKMKELLIAKNVASDIAEKLCASVSARLEGRQIGTLSSVSRAVREAVHDACVLMLTPKRSIDILNEVRAAAPRPFVIVFCGVNGVGKSTNLAKICFWLIENKIRVLIAGCDTFRAGAVEQLRTHVRRLNSLHPPPAAEPGAAATNEWVRLYEKGYGKDAAGIASEAIAYARDARYDVVLVDTAGRMQDNEPLMKALAKLIDVNNPDLVLFVGEALVGNDAVDQLVKFNRALSEHVLACNTRTGQPHSVDGIVLTKFDTVDDKVGAAISMVYTTGQPIVFVGTGQTYTDLYRLNARAVANALLK